MESYSEQHLVFLRWALIASLAYMILLPGEDPSTLELGYLALLLASNLAIPRIPYRNPQTFGAALLAVDTGFVLAGLLLCQTASQDLLVGYFLCIIMAAFGDSERRVAGAAFLVAGVYSLWLFQTWNASDSAAILIRLPFLFITTVFYGFLMQHVRREHARRVDAETRVHGLDCLLQVTRSFSSSLVTSEILDQVADTLRRTLDVSRCRIDLVTGSTKGPWEPAVIEALERREPVVAERPGGSCSVLALPIVHGVEPLGVLLVEAERESDAFGPDEVELCQVIAHTAAAALKNARQYESLVEIERTKSEFLANLSHELRTPLSAILGYSELAADKLENASGDGVGEIVENISRNAIELTRHVDNLLYLSQVTLGRERRRLDRVDLPEVLDRSLEAARRLAVRREIDFRLEVDPEVGAIYADGEKLERILQHILLNAVKFTNRGSIHLSAALVSGDTRVELPAALRPWERLLSVSIRDTGIGLQPGDLERVFREFRQGDGSTTRKYPGLGLGLSVCSRLADILGGTIKVQSENGRGSVFEVFLPVQLQPDAAVPAA